MSALSAGFADPPAEAARAFRAALDAMARPGTRHRLAGPVPPAGLSPAAAGLLLTLCDAETPLHRSGPTAAPDVADWIGFHVGAPQSPAETCAFAVGPWEALAPLDRYPAGSEEYPDRAATLIIELASWEGQDVTLSGPGIAGISRFALPDPASFAANADRFPRGIDAFFACGEEIAALPRSTRIGLA